jgi:hypothetical protein
VSDIKHLTQFIVDAARVAFETPDGQRWRMRQPTSDEAADGDSAYRLARQRVLQDGRLKELAGGKAALEAEASARAAAAEAVYMLPLLLEREDGQAAFDVFDAASLAEFEALPREVIIEMTKIYWGPIQQAAQEAKKKSRPGSSTG